MNGENKMSDFIDDIHDEADKIAEVSNELFQLSRSFQHIGNYNTSDILSFSAKLLAESEKRIRECVSAKINQDFQAAQDRSATILKTALAAGSLNRNMNRN
jgi:hypothetical protein